MTARKRIVVVGAGGFGREVLDVVDAINEERPQFIVSGVVDDHPSPVNLARLIQRSVPYLGTLDDFIKRSAQESPFYVVGIGSPRIRELVAGRLDEAGLMAATLIHPSVTRGFGVSIGEGSVICAGVRLTTSISIGRHVHVNLNVTVGHDSQLEDFVSVNPLASISGDCVIEERALVGVAGVILQGLRVGADSVVGGCACVVRDVPDRATVVGVPAQ